MTVLESKQKVVSPGKHDETSTMSMQFPVPLKGNCHSDNPNPNIVIVDGYFIVSLDVSENIFHGMSVRNRLAVLRYYVVQNNHSKTTHWKTIALRERQGTI